VQPSVQYPVARQRALLVDQVGYETIIFDEDSKEAHSLNRMASIVWRHCDGKHAVPELATLLSKELGIEANDSLVRYALDMLANANLLQNEEESRVSRRAAMKRVAAAGMAAAALPTILTIVAPTTAMAESGVSTPPPDPGPD